MVFSLRKICVGVVMHPLYVPGVSIEMKKHYISLTKLPQTLVYHMAKLPPNHTGHGRASSESLLHCFSLIKPRWCFPASLSLPFFFSFSSSFLSLSVILFLPSGSIYSPFPNYSVVLPILYLHQKGAMCASERILFSRFGKRVWEDFCLSITAFTLLGPFNECQSHHYLG